jgi:hypothetical protein
MKILLSLLAGFMLGITGPSASAGGSTQQEGPVLGQTSMNCLQALPGEGTRYEVDDSSATLRRTKNGVTASVSMPTPLPGTYCYPPAAISTDPSAGPAVAGFPEAWSLWGIYFNNPEQCLEGGCSAADVLGSNCENAQAGAVQLGGHITGGRMLHISGHLSKGHGPLGALGCAPLTNIDGAEIHLAVAPHGMLRPDLMPTLIEVPPGGGPGYWFPSVFPGID